MSNNIFKTQKPPKKNNNTKFNTNIKTNTNTNKNTNTKTNAIIFKTNEPEFKNKTELFEIKDVDFPDLEQQTQLEERKKEKIELNFKHASLKEKENINNDYFIPIGWTVFRMVDRKVIIDGALNNRIKEKNNSIEDYHSIANITFNKLIDNWENYKINYDKLHGFGEYDRFYKMPIPFNENIHIHNDIFSEHEENDTYEDNVFGYGDDDEYENDY
jgi:hypothetical protein